jgi:D-psicose/D-tagatose/L-ribulose 3-epimerase
VKYGVNTFIWTAEFGTAEMARLPSLREHGFDGVELPLFSPDAYRVPEVRHALEASGLDCTFCAVLPEELSVISDDAAVRRKTLTHLTGCVKLAAEIGGKIVAGPLYSPVGFLPGRRRTSEEWKRAVDFYQELGPALAQAGVTIALEPLNRFETFFLNTAADAARLCAEIGHPNVGILYDTFHANIEEKCQLAALRAAARFLRHFHASENDRGTPGTGHVDWNGIFATLAEIGYDGWITIESFGFSLGQLSAAASIWRDLAPSPESIAFDGVKFLRQAAAR